MIVILTILLLWGDCKNSGPSPKKNLKGPGMNRVFRVLLFLLLALRTRPLDMSKKPKIDHEDRAGKRSSFSHLTRL